MIELQNVSKKIHHHAILKNINFTVKNGAVTGVVGRNGAGKTTLLRMMAGIFAPTTGDIAIAGNDVFKQPLTKKDIVFVPDSTDALKTYTIKEITNFYQMIYPKFEPTYFHDMLKRFEFNKTGKIKNFSKGQKALFSLILAFSTKADYILLDEPTDGLDVIIKKQVLQLIAEEVASEDLSVVISSHRLDELEKLADHIVVLKGGEVDSELDMDSLKSQYHKIQVAYEGQLPEEIKNRVEILNTSGRVYVLLIESSDEETLATIKTSNPILYEELPLSLEDVFIAKLGGDLYAS